MVSSGNEIQSQTNMGESLKDQADRLLQKVKEQDLVIWNLQQVMEQQGKRMKEQEHERLACYYPYLMLIKEGRTCRMIEILRLEIAQVIKFNEDLLVTMEDCLRRALRIDRSLALIKEREAMEDKASDEQTSQGERK